MGQQDSDLSFGEVDDGATAGGPVTTLAPNAVQLTQNLTTAILDSGPGQPIWINLQVTEATDLTTEKFVLHLTSSATEGGSYTQLIDIALGTGDEVNSRPTSAVGVLPNTLQTFVWVKAAIEHLTGDPTAGKFLIGLGSEPGGYMIIAQHALA